jgi:hypothetical protein
MSGQIDLSQGLELRDPAGRTVGVVLAPQTAESLTSERDELRSEVACLQEEVRDLRQALTAAQQEVKDKAAITAERDQYLKALYHLLYESSTFTAEDIAEMDKNGETLDQFLKELERMQSR